MSDRTDSQASWWEVTDGEGVTVAIFEVEVAPVPPGLSMASQPMDAVFQAILDAADGAIRSSVLAQADVGMSGRLLRTVSSGSDELLARRFHADRGHYQSPACYHGHHGRCCVSCPECAEQCCCRCHS